MKTKLEIKKIIFILENTYEVSECGLTYDSPLQLLISARLSAQCTDKKVNIVTPYLFSKFKTVNDFEKASENEIQKIIKPCGLYKTKSKNIIDISKKLISDFQGKVPYKMEDLISLPGIGRKTANLVRAEIYNLPAIIVDTHFSRITKRIGFHNLKDPLKIEIEMKKVIPENKSIGFCHRMVSHGRKVCKSRNPICKDCTLSQFCDYYNSII